MTHSKLARHRISLVPNFDELFNNLVPLARHDVSESDLDDGSDEQRIAYVMGWYLRALQVRNVPDLLGTLVAKEVERRSYLLGQEVHPDVAARFATRRTAGTRMTAGNCLIPGDLDDDTLFLMWSRIVRVHEFLEMAGEYERQDKEYKLIGRVPMSSDQTLVDLLLYFAVQAPEGDGLAPELGPEPVGVHDMLVEFSRQLRADSVEWRNESGEPLDSCEAVELNEYHPGEYEAFARVRKLVSGYIPPLNSETEMFRRRNRIAPDDAFWTDERISDALALGFV